MYEKLKDAIWLREQYVGKTRTMQDIATEIGCNKNSVFRALKKAGISRRKHTSKYAYLNDKDWLVEEYSVKRRTIKDIATELGTTPGNVHSHLSALSVQTRGAKETYNDMHPEPLRGSSAGNWRGGRRIKGGYVFLYSPDHPYAVGGVVQEHRLIMEEILGRYLEPYEVVHHRDGNRQNNDPSNLELKTRGMHISEHFKASHEVLELRSRIEELEKENERLRIEAERCI